MNTVKKTLLYLFTTVVRSVNFGPYISRTENPNELRPTYSELSDLN